MIEITSLRKEHLPEAAQMFVEGLRRLRRKFPALPDRLDHQEVVAEKIGRLCGEADQHGLAAVENGRLAGYINWLYDPHFRHTSRKGAYCPEWAHGARPGSQLAVYRALYRAASAQWAADGCEVHALTLLADDDPAREAWFGNGFGLIVVDALRAIDTPILVTAPGVRVRQASPADAALLYQLECEHWQHYRQPPIFMATNGPSGPDEIADLLCDPKNSYWLAECEHETAGFLRFEAGGQEAAGVLRADTTVAITGAYVRPPYRGRRACPALLEAARRYYAGLGFERCVVDFESFNPEAAAFWLRYFEPVCLSLTRIPEVLPGKA